MPKDGGEEISTSVDVAKSFAGKGVYMTPTPVKRGDVVVSPHAQREGGYPAGLDYSGRGGSVVCNRPSLQK